MTFFGFLNFISQDMNHFLGFFFVMGSTYTFVYKLTYMLWFRLFAAITIWKNGYPPEHTDVMGDTWNVDLCEDKDEDKNND
jgi:hypothetical protein